MNESLDAMRSVLNDWDAAARGAMSQYLTEKENNIKFELSKLSPQPHDIILLKIKTDKNGNLFHDIVSQINYAEKLIDALDANGLKNQVVLMPDNFEVICKEDATGFRLELEKLLSVVKKVEEQTSAREECLLGMKDKKIIDVDQFVGGN